MSRTPDTSRIELETTDYGRFVTTANDVSKLARFYGAFLEEGSEAAYAHAQACRALGVEADLSADVARIIGWPVDDVRRELDVMTQLIIVSAGSAS